MILYDKSGLFLGMGTQELSLLGYEDMEEFRNYHNDIADLFINKPGYIFKFKNFSWIDYTLHSGTPNRRVLIKTKNGREVDSALHIYEIFLTQDLYGAKSCFGVEFVSNAHFGKTEAPLLHSTPNEPTFEPLEDSRPKEPTSFIMEDAPVFTSPTREEEIPALETEHTIESTFEPQSSVKAEEPFRNVGDIKLKFDSDILSEPSLVIKPSFVESEDIFPSSSPLFKEDAALETYPEDAHEDLLNDSLLFIKEPFATPFEATKANEPDVKIETPKALFDFSLSAETLGLDISTLAEIITEYADELDSKMSLITKALESGNTSYVKEEIDKLKRVALHLHIIPLYDQFERLEEQLDSIPEASALPALLRVQNVISDLKDSLQC